MAERRMFAKTIIDSDAFLDMPLSAQALYFHLSMRADDDGFINNPKKIQRMVGASDDDCKLLIMKRFIITFDSGVIVIKHWKIHNYIRNDRYKPTVYQDEKSQIVEKDNKVYTEIDNGNNPFGIPNGYRMDTQGRLGEVSLELDKNSKEEEENEPKPTYQQIADLYNDTCVSLPRLITLSDARKKSIKARLNKYSIEQFKQMFTKAEESDFLKGDNGKNWQANFDWLIKDSNFAKVLDGNYDNKKPKRSPISTLNHDAIERMFNSIDEPPKTAANDPELKARVEALKNKIQGDSEV